MTLEDLMEKRDDHVTSAETALRDSKSTGASDEYSTFMQQECIAHATLAIFYQGEIARRER